MDSVIETLKPLLYLSLGIIVLQFAIYVIREIYIINKNSKYRKRIYNEEYISASEFLENWRGTRTKNKYQTGYKTQDHSGCYVILCYNKPLNEMNKKHYSDIYIGQSVHVCQRVYQHLTGHGNGDVYHAYKCRQYVYIVFYPCSKKEMNRKEKDLISAFNATKSFNRQKGGSKKY